MALLPATIAPGRKPVGLVLLAIAALAALSYQIAKDVCNGSCFSSKPLQPGSTCAAETATCGGKTWEKLTCHNPTTCLDHYGTCHSWDVCSCCSSEPLYKCLLPTAAKAFAPDCASPIDARQQCCGDAVTHERTTDIEEAIKAFAANTTAAVQETLEETDLDEKTIASIKEGYENLHKFVDAQHNDCADLNVLTDAQKKNCEEQAAA